MQQARELIAAALDALKGQPKESTDEELLACFERRGISSTDAVRLLALLPVAFGRAALQQRGVVAFPDEIVVGHPGGKNTRILLSDQPIYAAGFRIGVHFHHVGVPPKAFFLLANRSAEVKAVLSLLQDGVPPDQVPGSSTVFYGYEEGVFVKPPWWRRRITLRASR